MGEEKKHSITAAWIGALGAVFAAIIGGVFLLASSPSDISKINPPNSQVDNVPESDSEEKSNLLLEHNIEQFFTIFLEDWFPGAKENFIEISFIKLDGKVFPNTISFLVGSDYYADNSIDESLIQTYKASTENYLRRVYKQKTFVVSCQEVGVGEEESYAYYPGIQVRRVTITVSIGC